MVTPCNCVISRASDSGVPAPGHAGARAVLSFLADPIAPIQVKAMDGAARSLGVTLQVQDIRRADDIPAAFAAASTAARSTRSAPSSTPGPASAVGMARLGYDLALTRHRVPHELPARLARWVGRGDYTLAGDPERRVAGGAIAKSGSFSDRGVAALMRARGLRCAAASLISSWYSPCKYLPHVQWPR